MAIQDQAANMASLDYRRKRKSRSRKDGTKNVEETIAKWKEYNEKLDSVDDEGKPVRKVPAKGSKKGCMKGKGGPENAVYQPLGDPHQMGQEQVPMIVDYGFDFLKPGRQEDLNFSLDDLAFIDLDSELGV